MKIYLLFFLPAFLLNSVLAFGQCNTCTDPSNRITDNGDGTLTAASAQEYYWEICEGNATISGSNTNQTVSVTASGDYRIRLKRFNGGNCTEACEIILSCSLADCPTKVQLLPYFLCDDGFGAYLNMSADCVYYVAWTWDYGHGGVGGGGALSPITYDPNLEIPGYSSAISSTITLEVIATVHLSPFLDCPTIKDIFTIQCPD